MDTRAERLRKLEELKKLGIEPFAYAYDRTHTAGDIVNAYAKHEGARASVAGRIYGIRTHGKLTFIDLQDATGKIQVYVSADSIGDAYAWISRLLDRGDHIGAKGKVMKTLKGEVSIAAEELVLLSKCLYPIPSTWFGLKDVEVRYRQRYLDMVMNPDVRRIFAARTKIIQAAREFLDKHGYVEVETPILQPIYGGAMARPFKTHHNDLDVDMYLRIADELYLKRLVVAGMEKVYEISKDFRNESIDTTHNPEFTMLEFYEAYVDYEYMMGFVERLFQHVAIKALGTLEFEYQGQKINLKSPWRRVTMEDAVRGAGIETFGRTLEELRALAKKHGLETDKGATRGELIEAFFEEFVEPKIVNPTFITDYPVEVSPLAKMKRGEPGVTERFELFITGREFANAFSELNDPIDQRSRFEQQAAMRKRGHAEAHQMDEDFIRALECGMPPTGGVGIGIDRLVMLLTNQSSIKEVILFPQMVPERAEKRVEEDRSFGDEVKGHVVKKVKKAGKK
ncbi:MAG: lysine--tRNA ligase [Candidatus Aenigmatarchaeota archaeon]|nr:MAG: lysine--tRNA ligase [Candidatus Aenigmarchaeota archaeon]